ncbi:hypothetical protein FAM09_12030 [Niastella caeni]|uniref:Uncharacterized protein n=1 Tax=Niastella caeni TaxID=2569763 RepID=A0A4S8HV05_9BACT|nr:hypothetical protein [Niastella caeni]THU39235.1 hypothetical protein FAM09_12030 [Niastella caeni]
MSKAKKQQVPAEKPTKKELSKLVFEKLSGSLTDFQLKEKKLENRLEKVSRRLAADIVKLYKKETPKSDKTATKKKAVKKEKLAVAE